MTDKHEMWLEIEEPDGTRIFRQPVPIDSSEWEHTLDYPVKVVLGKIRLVKGRKEEGG